MSYVIWGSFLVLVHRTGLTCLRPAPLHHASDAGKDWLERYADHGTVYQKVYVSPSVIRLFDRTQAEIRE